MAKILPLVRRLEIALECTSSESEKEIVYGRLARFVNQEFPKSKNFEEFYGKLNNDTLSPSYNRKSFSKEEIQNGKKIKNFLEIAISSPEIGNKVYKKKLKQTCLEEYDLICDKYFSNK